jgi:hypothetical protein
MLRRNPPALEDGSFQAASGYFSSSESDMLVLGERGHGSRGK